MVTVCHGCVGDLNGRSSASLAWQACEAGRRLPLPGKIPFWAIWALINLLNHLLTLRIVAQETQIVFFSFRGRVYIVKPRLSEPAGFCS